MAIARVAMDGNVDGLKYQIARGAPLDGSDGEHYDGDARGCLTGAPMEIPLGEAARMGHLECVRVLLDAGAPIDTPDFRGETALIMAAFSDRLDVVKLLLERGANVAHEGFAGNALAQTQIGWKPNAVAIAKLLLAAGCPVPAERWVEQVKQAGKREVKVQKALLEVARVAGAAEIVTMLEKKLGVAAKGAKAATGKLDKLAQAKGATWAKDVGALLTGIDKPASRERIEQVCKVVLASPAAVAHRAWPDVVKKAIAASWTYGDISERVYGKRKAASAMASDEGGAADAYTDDHLYTFDWVLGLLATPAALAHPAWPDLVLEVCKAKQAAVGTYSVCDEEIAALLARPEARGHARHGELITAAKRANPYAKL